MEKNSDKSVESQGENSGRKRETRRRQYAFIVYQDSSPEDWIARLDAEHIEALISPFHDQDVNPDGTLKKPHWHVMLMFAGHKSRVQVDEIRNRVLGENYNKALEEIQSVRGYARYLVHADNPEKHQYSRLDVKALGGVDYDAVCSLPSDDIGMIGDMFEFIVEHDIRYFCDFMRIIRKSNAEWFSMLVTRKSYIIVEFIKSQAVKMRDAEGGAGRFPTGYYNNVAVK